MNNLCGKKSIVSFMCEHKFMSVLIECNVANQSSTSLVNQSKSP
jgi:hypothetical protein